jgi:nitroreductase
VIERQRDVSRESSDNAGSRGHIAGEIQMAEEMGLFEVMYNCRAMRHLDTREVPEAILVRLVDAANQAPSGSNLQNGRWIIVRDPAVKGRLAELNRAAVTAYVAAQPASLPHQPEAKRKRMLDAVLWQMENLHRIPALIIACLEFDREIDDQTVKASGGSIWPGVQNLLLAARALGLGATPTTLALGDQSKVRQVLALPKTMGALCMVPVGYPLGNFGPVKRRPVAEIMRFDTWS